MQITFLSILNSAVWCGLLLLFLHTLRKKGRFSSRRGMAALSLLYAAVIARALLPLDFDVSFILPVMKGLPEVYLWIIEPRGTAGRFEISALSVLAGIWGAGFCLLLAVHVFRYRRTIRKIERFAEPASERAQAVLTEISQTDGHGLRASLLTLPGCSMPCSIGILRKRILLPDAAYTDEALRCILLHEYTHLVNRDPLIKQITAGFCMFFWWHPAAYLLKRDVEQAIEVRCDLTAAERLSRAERIIYLETIVCEIQSANSAAPYASAGLSAGQESAAIRERFQAVLSDGNGQARKGAYTGILCGFALLLFLSYAVIVQPCSKAPASTEPGAIDYEVEDAYILHTQGGEYWLYIPNMERELVLEKDLYIYEEIGFRIIEE